ncbi:hypothetical protein Nepgr_001684 [Nepenthes gracilis]|uniref:Uncharacterized protein n=1 Tax=Nepenthes gracilis TaxID=150966 RepID=A0AAD3P6G3_NEPGR|nr:hypothetical protein Nepgr_001684 [Nepenthes gracilis]
MEVECTSEESLQHDSPAKVGVQETAITGSPEHPGEKLDSSHITTGLIETPGDGNGSQDSITVSAETVPVGHVEKGDGATDGFASENDAKFVAKYRRRVLRRSSS